MATTVKKVKKRRKKKKGRRIRLDRILILVGLPILFVVLLVVGYRFMNPLGLKSKHLELVVNEKYDYRDNIDHVHFGKISDVKIDRDIDTSKEDEYTVVYSYKNHDKKCKVTVTSKLLLRDYKTDLVEEVNLNKFVPEGFDLTGYTLTSKVEDFSKEGKTKVKVEIVGPDQKKSKQTVYLYREKDITAPTIEIVNDKIEIDRGGDLDASQIIVKDDMDKNPTVSIEGNFDNITPGDYDVKLVATDRSGNKTELKTKVTVLPKDELDMKVVYLTFDDGPSYNTPAVLDILDQYNVKATFFVTGHDQGSLDCIKREYEAGHTVALHTYTHDYAIYSSTDTYFEDLTAVGNMVKDIIGFVPKEIRFPGGASNTISANYSSGIMSTLVNAVHDRGYEYYDWNVGSGDAAGNNVPTDQIIANSCSGEGDHLVILFHDAAGKETTVEALPAIIEYYKSQGYVFLPIHKETTPECHHGVNN